MQLLVEITSPTLCSGGLDASFCRLPAMRTSGHDAATGT